MSDKNPHQESEEIVDALSDSNNFDIQDAEVLPEADLLFQQIHEELEGERDLNDDFTPASLISDIGDISGSDVEDESIEEIASVQVEQAPSKEAFEDLFQVSSSKVVNNENQENNVDLSEQETTDTHSSDELGEKPFIDASKPTESSETKKNETDEPDINASSNPWYLNANTMIAGAFLVLVLFFAGGGYAIYQAFSSDSSTQAVTHSSAPQPEEKASTLADTATSITDESLNNEGLILSEQPEQKLANEIANDVTTSTDQIFNGVDIIHAANNADYTNIDPITKNLIDGLKNSLIEAKSVISSKELTITQHLVTISGYEEKIAEVTQQNQNISAQNEQLMKSLKKEGEKVAALNKELISKNEEIHSLQIDLQTEKRLTQREKQGRVLAEKRYASLQKEQSQEFLGMQKAIESLGLQFNDVMKEKEQKEATRLLSQLTYIDVQEGVGRFVVMKNGKASKPITLKAGETLIGRGVVKHVDDYGCVIFEDGGYYQPINGYCP